LKFMAPRAGYSTPEEYAGLPMDYCFLFDAQNVNGQQLNSKAEYIEHAASCIYGMAIAPTSSRSNSSEDNVIRELVAASGKNRYAGAGASVLVYPYEDVLHYLALTWARDSISNEWLSIDRQFGDKLKANRRRQREGYQVAELDRGDDYIKAVDRGFRSNRSFESAIRRQCVEYEKDGFTETGLKWDLFVDELENYIEENVEDQKGRLVVLFDELGTLAHDAKEDSADADAFSDYYKKLLGYKGAAIRQSGSIARNIEYTVFRDSADFTKEDEKFRPEYWMHKGRQLDDFMHPNAIRYLLYNIRVELKMREAEAREELREIEDFWNSFETDNFDDPKTKDIVETADEYLDNYHLDETSKIKRLFHRHEISLAQSKLRKGFADFKEKTDSYWLSYVSAEVYGSGVAYVEALDKAFEAFYAELANRVSSIDRDIAKLEEKYTVRPGKALRYVCSDQLCLRGLADDCPNPSSSLELPPELCRSIFRKMKTYALMDQKSSSAEYFAGTFKDTIVSHLEDVVSSEYGNVVKMDILSAIAREAAYETGDPDMEQRDIDLYVEGILANAEMLAKPFIEAPMGREPRIISACSYSTLLSNPDIAGREDFVKRNLQDHGGVDDETFDTHIIMFYQSIYGIQASQLGKFAPAEDTETSSRQAGEYYKAYHELISEIHPEPQKSKMTTPHIDRWWHLINKLPELDDRVQVEQERRICAAFFWGMVSGWVNYVPKDVKNDVYQPNSSALKLESDDSEGLIVSTDEYCDCLYEVLDAFTIYPKLVEKVMDVFGATIKEERQKQKLLSESFAFRCFEKFELEEFDSKTAAEVLPAERIQELVTPLADIFGIRELAPYATNTARSVFDLLVLMKYSVPAEKYHETEMLRLLETIYLELKGYVRLFCKEEEVNEEYARLLCTQFISFLFDMAAGRGLLANVFGDKLFRDICDTLAAQLKEECGMETASAAVEDCAVGLRRIMRQQRERTAL